MGPSLGPTAFPWAEGAIRIFIGEGIHAYDTHSVDGIALHAQILWGDPPAIMDTAEVSIRMLA